MKLAYVAGLCAKAESPYGTWSTPVVGSDGIEMQFADRNLGNPIEIVAAYDGDQGPAVGSLGTVVRVAPSGFSAKAAWPMRLKGSGVAYSASVVPHGHVMLLSSGLTGTVTTTPGSEKWAYVPSVPGVYGSHSALAYARDETYQLKGGVSSWSYDAPNAGPPIHTFDTRYILHADPADASLAAITYPLAAVRAPLATAITFVMGSLTTNAVVYSHKFSLTREIENPRVAQTAAGAHLGFVPGGWVAELEVMLEAMPKVGSPYTSSTAFDEYQLWKNATLLSACSVQIGSTQYNRYKIDFGARAQVASFTWASESPVGKTTLKIRTSVSSPTASDGLEVTFD